MRIYEQLFIAKPDITDEELDPMLEQLKSVVTKAEGTVDKVDKWGVRKLAYRVKKKAEGYYVLIQYSAPAAVPKELERRLRVQDSVLKFITVRLDERMKLDARAKKKREERAAKRPVVQTVTPGAVMPGAAPAPAPALPAEPAAPAPGAPPAAPASEPQE
jgi:small subunit ribosomal protein S6